MDQDHAKNHKFQEFLEKMRFITDPYEKHISSYDVEETIKKAVAHRQLQGKPTLTFTNNRANEGNFLSELIKKEHETYIMTLNENMWNCHGFCQSYHLFFAEMLTSFSNPLHNYDIYVEDGEYETPDCEYLSADQLEDMACYAFIRSTYSYSHSKAMTLGGIRKEIYYKLIKIIVGQINQKYPAFKAIYKGNKIYFYGWYLYTASLVKRVYGIDPLAGDGSGFKWAFLGRAKDISPSVTHQAYVISKEMPAGVEYYDIITREEIPEDKTKEEIKEEIKSKGWTGHAEAIMKYEDLTDPEVEVLLVHFDGKSKMQVTVLKTGKPSILRKLLDKLCNPTSKTPITEDQFEDAKHFGLIGQNMKVTLGFFERRDIVDLDIPESS